MVALGVAVVVIVITKLVMYELYPDTEGSVATVRDGTSTLFACLIPEVALRSFAPAERRR